MRERERREREREREREKERGRGKISGKSNVVPALQQLFANS